MAGRRVALVRWLTPSITAKLTRIDQAAGSARVANRGVYQHQEHCSRQSDAEQLHGVLERLHVGRAAHPAQGDDATDDRAGHRAQYPRGLFLGLSSVRWKVPRLLRTALGLTQRLGPVLDYLPAEPVGSGVKTAEGEGVSRGDVTGDGVADTERVATGVGGGVAVGTLVGWSVLAVVGFGAGLGLVVRAGAGM